MVLHECEIFVSDCCRIEMDGDIDGICGGCYEMIGDHNFVCEECDAAW